MALSVHTITMLLALAKTKSTRDMLMCMYVYQYVEPPLLPRVVFSLDSYAHANALLDFRFDVVGIKRLGYLLRVGTNESIASTTKPSLPQMAFVITFGDQLRVDATTQRCSRTVASYKRLQAIRQCLPQNTSTATQHME
ncbi:hypothetical protein H257_12566 [Aphanomyces astaci]|uniref:Uncharacterized protein n=1 Tax=Aphanomyces astaci TaxID=112090 RepID=W4G060_APHAT|nr:hypothetical protein H257_12566 [Aphanomyces astaci]ETV72439.1 hypothetical protein H257_12566 [Aphanomyces astaci]|eukprot:XP_009838121.1 hypothetical protein H257_12566 [Aphanomyces astaci]